MRESLHVLLLMCIYTDYLNGYFIIGENMNSRMLSDGEYLTSIADFPTLMYYIPGNRDKELVVFVPGGYHLARVSYGLSDSFKPDFLAYWFQQQGYSFLGLSYPLDNEVFDEIYPTFSIHNWAYQIVEAVKMKIESDHLPKKFIMLGWSMAGKSACQVNRVAEAKGLQLTYISLSSVPSPNGLIPSNIASLQQEPNPKGLSGRESLTPWFIDQLHDQNEINDHIIIEDDAFSKKILGDMPFNLPSTNLRFESGKIQEDIVAMLLDIHAMD